MTRIMNLLGAFHSQMIEMMGAMGIREVRRLRGEMGRAMVFNDLEAGSFAPLFGKRLEPSQAPTCQPQPMPDPRVYRDIAVDGPKPAPTLALPQPPEQIPGDPLHRLRGLRQVRRGVQLRGAPHARR